MNQPIEGSTVLVIEDDAVIRLMSCEALSEAGYEMLEAASAEAGLAIFDERPVDLVLMDVMLPGINGFEACKRIRSRVRGSDVPVIVMTGRDDRGAIVAAYDAGATDFITKPMLWDLLPYRVRYALRAHRALREIARSRALLARSQGIAHMGSWEWAGNDEALVCSEELHRIQGTDPGSHPSELGALLDGVHPEDSQTVAAALEGARKQGQAYRIEFRVVRPDGEVRRVFEQTDIERDAAAGVFVVRGIRLDITQQDEARRRISMLANYDTLTGLANRSLLRRLVQRWLPYADRQGLRCAVLVIGLDRFKLINETLGPAVGDAVLKAVGERLRRCVRPADPRVMGQPEGGEEPLARLGGDEFALLVVDVPDAEMASRIAQRLFRALAEPTVIGEHELDLTCSIGIAMTPTDGDDADTLLTNAGTAVHVAKREGRGRIRHYDAAMSVDVKRSLSIETDLRRALHGDELRVVYQPKVDTRTATVIGAEVLLRWQHRERGLIGPNEFIPIAQSSGLIVPMTDWVIRSVCRHLSEWRTAGIVTVPVSINIDAASLHGDGLVETLVTTLATFDVHPSLIELEVTESSLMHDLDGASRLLDRFKRIGLKLSLDDFGTGYSSLTYLKRFPMDVLKIDRSFIKDLPDDNNDAALTSAIIAMGQSLGLELVAEGVETEAQSLFLTDRGCHLVQGYLYARPLPIRDFENVLRNGLTIVLPRALPGRAPSAGQMAAPVEAASASGTLPLVDEAAGASGPDQRIASGSSILTSSTS